MMIPTLLAGAAHNRIFQQLRVVRRRASTRHSTACARPTTCGSSFMSAPSPRRTAWRLVLLPLGVTQGSCHSLPTTCLVCLRCVSRIYPSQGRGFALSALQGLKSQTFLQRRHTGLVNERILLCSFLAGRSHIVCVYFHS